MRLITQRQATSYLNNDLASGVPFQHVTDGGDNLSEWVGPIDGGDDLASLNQFSEGHEVLGILGRDECAQLLTDERGQQLRPELTVNSAEPPAAGLPADNDEPAASGEDPPEM